MTTFESKAPHEAILDLPQERITGDILRGRGPRRGNLERLIKYWRPIMRKPGGFRRCLVILADHPELYPLERICAWLHHETTGLWPNEGNHHEGGKLGPIVSLAKRTVKKPKRKKRGKRKKDDGVYLSTPPQFGLVPLIPGKNPRDLAAEEVPALPRADTIPFSFTRFLTVC